MTKPIIYTFVCALLIASTATAQTKGRYVHIYVPGNNKTLSLAEVQVMANDKNIALNKKTSQLTVAHGGASSRAVDGNTSGAWGENSITHTQEGITNPAWEVDLGNDFDIDSIQLWNRNSYENRLNGVQILILDKDRKAVWGQTIKSPCKNEIPPLQVKDKANAQDVGKKIAKITTYKEYTPQSWTEETTAQNGGIFNGPLTDRNLGLKIKHEGNKKSLSLAINHLIKTYGTKYPKGQEFLKRLEGENMDDPKSKEFIALKSEVLVKENPAIDFDNILLVKGKDTRGRYTANWQTRTSSAKYINSDELIVMSIKGDGSSKTVFTADGGLIADVDLHFDANRILFSSSRDRNKLAEGATGYKDKSKGYSVFELTIDPITGKALSKAVDLIPDMGRDADAYDACFLPDGKIIFASTAVYEGVPCVGGADYVANLFSMNRDGSGIRRLTFEQDGNWHPTVMENGRILYLRWEYTDSAHYFSRVLMSMNPDGTDQKAYYGSNSYWPNSMFFSRQIPGKSSMFISSITGHHSNPKGGALGIFDVSKGRFEADGAVQLIGGHGKKVHPLVIDGLHGAYSPMFYTPYPINDKFFLAITQEGSLYLVDVFDNMVCLKKATGQEKYFEPVPLRVTKTPAPIPDRIDLTKKNATVLINDVYTGPGLAGVPRGAVKSIRVFRYEYGPRHKGGHYAMGMEAGWDAKQILGTVPVEEDGSASFTVPANTPFSMQPLDKDGKALAIMRSWTVAMPGERLSCIGCHESQNTTPAVRAYKAMRRKPSELEPFYGATRGFSFKREIQPIIDKNCVSCHDGAPANGRYHAPDRIVGTGTDTGKSFKTAGIPDFTNTDKAIRNIHPFVRRTGPEGDYHVLTPLEFHADTSELFQMLEKGHHNVKLDKESMDKLIAWADLNAPNHGTWTEAGANTNILNRRKELRKKYAFDDYDPEVIVNPYVKSADSIMPKSLKKNIVEPQLSKIGKRNSKQTELDLGDDITMKFTNIPKGYFSMGSNSETPMEQPISQVKIKRPFEMGITEVTLAQYRQFDPTYLNGVYDMHYKDQVHRGYYMNDIDYPVIRVPWNKAVEFCNWLSKKTSKKVSLPTEAQWEWACRAGTTTPMNYGDLNTAFSKHANLADITVKQMAVKGVNPKPINNPDTSMDFELKDPRSNDNALHLAEVASYKPNAWGLYDMHGNASEWTSSDYKPYPYSESDKQERKVVRGGSWKDRPYRSTSSYRLGYPRWQKVFNTGFRVIIED